MCDDDEDTLLAVLLQGERYLARRVTARYGEDWMGQMNFTDGGDTYMWIYNYENSGLQ